jgi:Tfp pilus assembly protein PilW
MARKNKEAGLTLIEFLLANLLMMVVLGGTFSLMNSLFNANTDLQEVLTTQQNLRVAMNSLTRDLTMAGTGLPDSGTPIPNGNNAVQLARPGLGIACSTPPGTGNGCLPTPNNVVAILSPGKGVGPTVDNVTTDVLTIAMVDETSPIWNASNISADGTVIDFTQDVRSGSTKMSVNDLLLFNNANGSAFGCVTTVSTSASEAQFQAADIMNVNQPTAQFGTIAATLQNAGSNPVTYPPTTATRVMLITYFLDNSVSTNPKLMRSVNGSAPQVMVEGIENLQFSFDLFDYTNNTDTSNVGTTANPNQIRSVRVAVNGHSPDQLKKTGDYYHFGLVSKVNIRNATFRNRYS